MPSLKARSRSLSVPAVVLAFALLFVQPASADGGKSIETATPVAFNEHQFGNTANGARTDEGCVSTYRSWWTLNALEGDQITIDWGSDQSPILHVFEVGVTDFTFANTDSFRYDTINSNHKSQLVFAAPQTGPMPLSFVTKQGCNVYDSDPGPYDFTASVTHKVVPSFYVMKNKKHKTTFGVDVSRPDGTPLDGSDFTMDVLRVRRGKWVTIGTFAADEFWIRWGGKDRGKIQRVRIKVRAPGYGTVTTGALRVRG